jgi:multifunctional methyltransferase subunit TRM112
LDILIRTAKGYPLIIEASQVVVEESPVDHDMIKRTLPKLDYAALVQAALQLSTNLPDIPQLPTECPRDLGGDSDETLVNNLHRILFDIHVMEVALVCPDTGRRFPIKDGIPNMILHEDEI